MKNRKVKRRCGCVYVNDSVGQYLRSYCPHHQKKADERRRRYEINEAHSDYLASREELTLTAASYGATYTPKEDI